MLGLDLGSPDVLVSACQDRHMRVLDLREPYTVRASHTVHTSSVLCVAASQHLIYSGGEDGVVCIWDIRNKALLRRITVEENCVELQLVNDM